MRPSGISATVTFGHEFADRRVVHLAVARVDQALECRVSGARECRVLHPGAPRTPRRCLTSLARIFAAARGAKSPASARGRRSANIQLAPELALTTSTNCCGSRPARTASASASAPAARFTAASRLLTILNLAASPGASPTRNTRPATAPNTGSQRATAVGGAGDHHGHGAVGGAARAAGDRRVDENDAVRGEAVRQRAGVVGRHRRREHDDRAGSKCRCCTVGAEEDVVCLSRVDDQHDRDVAGACQRCRDWDGRWRPAIRPRRGPRDGCRAHALGNGRATGWPPRPCPWRRCR